MYNFAPMSEHWRQMLWYCVLASVCISSWPNGLWRDQAAGNITPRDLMNSAYICKINGKSKELLLH